MPLYYSSQALFWSVISCVGNMLYFPKFALWSLYFFFSILFFLVIEYYLRQNKFNLKLFYMLLIERIYPPVFGTTKRPPRCPKMAAVFSSLLVEIEDRFWIYVALFLACIVPKALLFPWGKVPECVFAWYSALSVTPRDTMNELWTLTLMSDSGLNSDDSVMSSLSMGSCRQIGPLYVLLTVKSGCMDEFKSREFPGRTKQIRELVTVLRC